MDQFVHTTGTKGAANNIGYRTAGIDVRDELPLALRCVCSISKENNLGSLQEACDSTAYQVFAQSGGHGQTLPPSNEMHEFHRPKH